MGLREWVVTACTLLRVDSSATCQAEFGAARARCRSVKCLMDLEVKRREILYAQPLSAIAQSESMI